MICKLNCQTLAGVVADTLSWNLLAAVAVSTDTYKMPHNLLVFSWKKPSFDFRKASQFPKMLLCTALHGITWPRKGAQYSRSQMIGLGCINDHFPRGWPKHNPHTSILPSSLCSIWHSLRLCPCTVLKITFKQEQLEVEIVHCLQNTQLEPPN